MMLVLVEVAKSTKTVVVNSGSGKKYKNCCGK